MREDDVMYKTVRVTYRNLQDTLNCLVEDCFEIVQINFENSTELYTVIAKKIRYDYGM